MNTCHECKHWNPKAQACAEFKPLEAEKVQARVVWLKQRKAIA